MGIMDPPPSSPSFHEKYKRRHSNEMKMKVKMNMKMKVKMKMYMRTYIGTFFSLFDIISFHFKLLCSFIGLLVWGWMVWIFMYCTVFIHFPLSFIFLQFKQMKKDNNNNGPSLTLSLRK